MTAAVDKREYLVKLGLAKEGRGKFSNAAKEALAEAERNGIVFVDKRAIVTTVSVTDEHGTVTEEKREYNPFAPTPLAIRDGLLLFVGAGKKKERTEKKVSATEACENCRMSFGWCYCPVPVYRDWKSGEVLSLGDSI